MGFISTLFGPMMMNSTSYAAQITQRSLTLQTDTSLPAAQQVGGSDPGGTVDNFFQFTIPSTTTIEAIEFQYCSGLTSTGACSTTLPTGLTTTGAAIASTSANLSGFTAINNTTNGTVYISDSSGYTPSAANTALTVTLSGIVNPTTSNQTFYVTISTWTLTPPATGGSVEVDSGNVAASTANQIVLSGYMPESLVFCTGGAISETGGVPDCTTATSGNISFSMLFSSTSTAYTQSQMAASTNASHGYVITVLGSTLTSGTNSISAMTTLGTSAIGSSQFGMNLVGPNTTPTVGAALTPTSDGVSYFGYAETNYNTINSYYFDPGVTSTVADSTNGTASGNATDAQIYTVSYIVNVTGRQPPGTYTTTLTYICTPTF